MTQPNQNETQLPLATLGVRTLAFIIDAVIILVVFVAVAVAISPTVGFLYDFLYGPPEGIFGELAYLSFAFVLAPFLATVLVLVIWGGIFEGIRGRTPGKAVAGLRVVSADDHTQAIGFARGIAREIIRSLPTILYSLPFILFNRSTLLDSETFNSETFEQFVVYVVLLSVLVFLLDQLWPLWDKKNQTLHDKIANSHVIYEEFEVTDHKIINKIYTIFRRMGLGSLI